MLTKNFKALMATILESNNGAGRVGILPIKQPNGTVYYITPSFSNCFPSNTSYYFTTSRDSTGIQLGTGSTPSTEDDYTLESIITGGLNASSAITHCDVDSSGNPFLDLDLTVTNTSSNDITVREIGYCQTIQCTTTKGGTSYTGRSFLLDRTVLSNPVTIPAGQYAVIRYTLKTIIGS